MRTRRDLHFKLLKNGRDRSALGKLAKCARYCSQSSICISKNMLWCQNRKKRKGSEHFWKMKSEKCIDSSIHWFIGSLIHWCTDSSVHCFNASLIQCFIDSFIRWLIDSLVHPFIESVYHRFAVSSAHSSSIYWFTDSLIPWFYNSLIRWFVESSVSWIDALIHWIIDSLAHWFIDSWIPSFIDSLIRWFVQLAVHGLCHAISLASQPPFAHSLLRLTTSTLHCFCMSKTFLLAINFLLLVSFFRNFRPAWAGHYLVVNGSECICIDIPCVVSVLSGRGSLETRFLGQELAR